MPNKNPRSLDAWFKLIDGVRLPVPRSGHDRLRAALADSRRSLRDIAELMQDSPALVLAIMREANHLRHNNLGEPAESLETALSRLGLKRTEELLTRLPVLPDAEIPQPLRQLQLVSQHATRQANGLFSARLARLWQEIHWGSLLFLSPLWPLALTHPQLLQEWELRVMHRGESAYKVEHELFGVRLLAICRVVAESWRLPGWIPQGYRLLLLEPRLLVQVLHIARDNQHRLYQQQQLDDHPSLRRWLGQPANTVLLANGLALSSQDAWDNPHCSRWQYLTSLYLQVCLDDVQQQTHQNAATSARLHAAPDLWHPAEALLWPTGTRRVHEVEQPAAPPAAEDLARWRSLCADLLKDPSPFSNAMHLVTQARDALQTCGLRRLVILTPDREQTTLRVHQMAGLPEEAATLSVSLSQSRLLQRLLAQPSQIRLTPENNAQYSALLPASLRGLFKGEHLIMRSLASQGRVMLLLIADQDGLPFSDVTLQAMGKTAQCVERALTLFTNRGR